MSKKYFVEFTEYAGFGQLTITREMFASWAQLEFFKRQLRPAQVLSYGCIDKQDAQKVAA